jgi:hypothetical protein
MPTTTLIPSITSHQPSEDTYSNWCPTSYQPTIDANRERSKTYMSIWSASTLFASCIPWFGLPTFIGIRVSIRCIHLPFNLQLYSSWYHLQSLWEVRFRPEWMSTGTRNTDLSEVLELIHTLRIALSVECRIGVADFLKMGHIAISIQLGFGQQVR